MLSFLKPTPRSLALFAVLAFICVGGAIQSYAFIDDVSGVTKPPFYDLLKPLELWVPWIFFAAPVHLLGSLLGLRWLLRCFPSLGGVSAPVASLAYAYVISCWAVHSWDRWARYGRYGKLSPASRDRARLALLPPPRILTGGQSLRVRGARDKRLRLPICGVRYLRGINLRFVQSFTTSRKIAPHRQWKVEEELARKPANLAR